MNQLNAARALGQIQPVGVSLEQRLQYLTANVERVMHIRRRLTAAAGELTGEGQSDTKSADSPPAVSLSGKIGEQLSYLAVNLDEIEVLVARLENALFEPKAQTSPSPGRG